MTNNYFFYSGLGCRNGWTIFNKECISKITEPKLPFLEAKEYCNSLGATLLTVNNIYDIQRVIRVLSLGKKNIN